MNFNEDHLKKLNKIQNVNDNKKFSFEHPFEVFFETIELDTSSD